VGHRAAEVIIGLDIDLDLVAQTKSLLPAILFRSLNADLKLRQLVFFQPEERGLADIILATGVPEIDMVFAERHALGQFQRTPRLPESFKLPFTFLALAAARL